MVDLDPRGARCTQQPPEVAQEPLYAKRLTLRAGVLKRRHTPWGEGLPWLPIAIHSIAKPAEPIIKPVWEDAVPVTGAGFEARTRTGELIQRNPVAVPRQAVIRILS